MTVNPASDRPVPAVSLPPDCCVADSAAADAAHGGAQRHATRRAAAWPRRRTSSFPGTLRSTEVAVQRPPAEQHASDDAGHRRSHGRDTHSIHASDVALGVSPLKLALLGT